MKIVKKIEKEKIVKKRLWKRMMDLGKKSEVDYERKKIVRRRCEEEDREEDCDDWGEDCVEVDWEDWGEEDYED
jgi:hypothetical protein